MPRLPDPNSKTPQLTVRAINDKDVEMFRKLKEICAEKGVTIASKLRPAIEKIVAHEWPPNPQLQLGQFSGELPLSEETKEKLAKMEPASPPRKRINYKTKSTEELLRIFDSDLITPGDKIEVGQILRQRDAYPKKQDQPLGYTPRYGSG